MSKPPITKLFGDASKVAKSYSNEFLEDIMLTCEEFMQVADYSKKSEIDCANWYNEAEQELIRRGN